MTKFEHDNFDNKRVYRGTNPSALDLHASLYFDRAPHSFPVSGRLTKVRTGGAGVMFVKQKGTRAKIISPYYHRGEKQKELLLQASVAEA